ncbi:MAG: fasciclin domain-containing protein [Armatimonadota bacterium]|nr:fasciclin domain-containing protein [bacterium]
MADIVETIQQAGSFKRLIKALEKADLVNKLKGPGPFTLLAPNDKGFDKAGEGTFELLYHHIPSLRQVLLYHVLPGVHTFEDMALSRKQLTLNGDDVVIDANQGLRINNAKICKGNINADNGIIHIMEDVVLSKVEAEV